MNIYYTNLHCVYSIDGGRATSHACYRDFHNLYRHDSVCKHTITIHIYINKDQLENSDNNYCPFTIEQVRNYCRTISTYASFKYKVIPCIKGIEHRKQRFEITCTIEGSRTKAMFITTALRYLFEVPFNIYLMDAFKMNNDSTFKWYNIFDRLVLIQMYFRWNSLGHCIGYNNSRYSTKQFIINKINSISNMNALLNTKNSIDHRCKWDFNTYGELEFWENNDLYEERLKEYRKFKSKFES